MNYVSATKPYLHQKRALKKLAGREYYALFHEMRTGKTKVALDKFGALEAEREANDLLLIAPKGVYNTWVEAIATHVHPSLRKRLEVYVWDGASTKASQADLIRFLRKTDDARIARFLAVNVEAISRKDSPARDVIREFVRQRRCMTVIDEATCIKNPQANCTKFINGYFYKGELRGGWVRRHSQYRYILSGLPTPNSPLDAYSQFYFLTPAILGHSSFVTFRARYAKVFDLCTIPSPVLYEKLEKERGKKFLLEGQGMVEPRDLSREVVIQLLEEAGHYIEKVPLIKGYQNETELRDLIAPHSDRVLLKDCYDLPPKIYMKREVTLTKDQARIYADLKKRATAELSEEKHVTALMVITRLLRLHQIVCGHSVDDNTGELEVIEEDRTAEVLAALEEFPSGKAIIWASYDYDVRKIIAALGERYGVGSVSAFWGGNVKIREKEEKEFKTNAARRFMVATAAAGGRSRTWSVANLMIYYSNTNNLEHRLQSEMRAEGVGKTDPVAVIDIVAPGTVDVKIIESLRKKLNMSSVITGDNWKEWII